MNELIDGQRGDRTGIRAWWGIGQYDAATIGRGFSGQAAVAAHRLRSDGHGDIIIRKKEAKGGTWMGWHGNGLAALSRHARGKKAWAGLNALNWFP